MDVLTLNQKKGGYRRVVQKPRCLIAATIILVLALQLTACNNTYGHKYNPATDSLPKDEESYNVDHLQPSENQVYNASDPPPRFAWKLYQGLTESFVIEIDYLHDGSYITDEIAGRTNYRLSQEMWEKIKKYSPIVDGKQKICWRIRIDYTLYPEEGPYYTSWGTFWIENKK